MTQGSAKVSLIKGVGAVHFNISATAIKINMCRPAIFFYSLICWLGHWVQMIP